MKKKLLFGMTVLFMITAVMFIGCPESSSSSDSSDDTPDTPIVNPVGPDDPVINQQGDPTVDGGVTLTVNVPNTADVLSYQWWVTTENNNTSGTAISGANGPSYIPTGVTLGDHYYYVVITFKDLTTRRSPPYMVRVILSDKVNATEPFIPEGGQPKNAKYATDDIAAPLTVTATAEDSYGPNADVYKPNLSYQWYKSNATSAPYNSSGIAITDTDDAKTKSYTPSTANVSTGTYYYVVITNKISDNGDGGIKSASTKSDAAKIEVELGARAPNITLHPQSKEDYLEGATATPLTVAATSPDSGDLSFQWYRYKIVDNMPTGLEVLDGAEDTALTSSYKPSTDESPSVWYYYCKVTNTKVIIADQPAKTRSRESNTACIAVGVTALRLSGLTVESRPYEKGNKSATIISTSAVLTTLTPSPVTNPAGVTLVKGTANEFESDNAGTHAVTLGGWYLTGANKDKYLFKLQEGLTGTITKAVGSDVAEPEKDTAMSYKITVKAVGLKNPNTAQDVEYAIATTDNATPSAWQATRIFAGLSLGADGRGTKYYVYARAKEGDNYLAGKAEVSDEIMTRPGSEVTAVTVSTAVPPTDKKITVNKVDLVDETTGQGVEYAISKNTTASPSFVYQSSTSFDNLDGGSTYYVFARSKAVPDEWKEGEAKRSAGIRTRDPIVSFETYGAGRLPNVPVSKGTPLTKNDINNGIDLTLDGYKFDWWYKDSSYTVPYNFEDDVNSSFTLHAKWVDNDDITANGRKNMVWIPGGWFKMGSPAGPTPPAEPNRQTYETQHDVGISGFWMGKYEVTQKEWYDVMADYPSKFATSNPAELAQLPVEQVSWYSALVYCNKLSEKEGKSSLYMIKGTTDTSLWGAVPPNRDPAWDAVIVLDDVDGEKGYRLPTEAEWEYACRAGTTTAYSNGPTINNDTGWYTANSYAKTQKIGQKSAGNAFGLFDMHGNVAEWCQDWYADNYGVTNISTTTKLINPTGPSSGQFFGNGTENMLASSTFRVFRGGGWDVSYTGYLIRATGVSHTATWTVVDSAPFLRSAARNSVTYYVCYIGGTITHPGDSAWCPIYPYGKYSFLGFRVVRPAN